MENRKVKSVIRKIVILPIMVFSLFTIAVIVFGVLNYKNMERTIMHNNQTTIQISMNQLQNLMDQLETKFIHYIATSDSYDKMRFLKSDTPQENYFIYQSDTANWLSDEAKSFKEVEGAFMFYQNLDLLIFRGISNPEMHSYVQTLFAGNEDLLTQSRIVEAKNQYYVLTINRYGDCYNGYWMQVATLMESIGLNDKNLLGETYLIDSNDSNTLGEKKLNERVRLMGRDKLILEDEQYYHNYVVGNDSDQLFVGLLVPKNTIIAQMPLLGKVLLILGIAVIVLAPIMVIWLETKIANPIRIMNDAMTNIGNGDMEYRIPCRKNRKYDDEFDVMFNEFNHMMDKLNELEFNLYKTKIQKQRTELKYISQQIRPHFILNALNIIYTYEEKDFPLIQKMVLYLTDYFRYIVNLRVDFVELQKELRHVQTYLNIQKERYGDRFDFFVEWERDVNDAMVPPLIIQTFLENCIKYGMKNDGKSIIYVLANIEKEYLKIMVADTGNGFSQQTMEQITTFIETREYQDDLGVGIQNAIERLDILYNKKAIVNVRNALSGGAVVEIYLPLNIE